LPFIGLASPAIGGSSENDPQDSPVNGVDGVMKKIINWFNRR